tara:strand:+ start:4662 stop:5339 length:678 start_codon:yes stop_codon:yes gene_type:complete
MTEHKKYDLPIEVLAPWANIVLKTKIPDEVFKDLLQMYEEVMQSKWESNGQTLVGQIEEEPKIDLEVQRKHTVWINFCIQMIQKFISIQGNTNQVSDTTEIKKQKTNKILTHITNMWFVNQKAEEYNPAHVHSNCSISAIAYLKTPKNKIQSKKTFYDTDGKISFINNAGLDSRWSVPILNLEPKEQDFYIFPAYQTHLVYPYKSNDPKDIRVSISFNADIQNKK